MNALTDSLWTLVRWAVPVTVAGVIAAGAIGVSKIGDQVRSRVQARLAEEFPGLAIRVEAASLVDGEGIILRGVSVTDPSLPQQWRQVVWIDEVRLACTTNLAELATGPPRITTVRVRRPVIHAARRQDNTWTIDRLLAKRPPGDMIPIRIEDARVFIDDARLGLRLAMRQAALEVMPDTAAPGWATVCASADADLFDRATFQGRIAPGDGGFTIAGTVDGFEVSPRVAAAVAAAVPRTDGARDAAVGIRGRLSVDWKAAGSLACLDQTVFECKGSLDSGHLEHPRLPLVISDMKADFTADNNGVRIDDFQGHSGSTLLSGSGAMAGWRTDGDFDLRVEAKRLAVGRHWEGMLPGVLADQWRKLLPAGEVDVGAEVIRRGGSIDPRVSVRCRNVSLTHYRFPYRVDHAVGTVVFENHELSLHLTGQAGGHPVNVDGGLRFERGAASGHVEVRGEGMQIDDALLAAMPPRSADIVRSLRAAGTFDFVFRHERGPQLHGGRKNSLGIRLVRCSMAYAGFPYPLTNVSGNIGMESDHWTIRDITGSNDAGVVWCSGKLTPQADGDGELTLQLTGRGVVLERELRESLPSGMRQIWDDLDPRGSADFSATIRHHVKRRQTSVEVEATPHGQTVSIEPAWFPYRLEQLTGTMKLKNGLLQFDGVRGVHDRTTVAAEGTCRFLPGGGWHVSFANLSADRFRADHEVVRALPAGLQRAIELVRPRGLLALSGALDISSSNVTEGGDATGAAGNIEARTPSAAWDLALDMEQGSLDVGVPLEHVHGGVRLKGRSDGRAWQSSGEIAIDSAMCRGVQMTGISGPLAMDADGVRFGMVAGGMETGRPRRLEATIAGGKLAADGRMTADEAGSFAVALSLDDADFERLSGDAIARGVASPAQRYRGRLSGFLELAGSRAGSHALSGRGQIRLRDAAIYELPVVVSLLKVLRVKAPDRNAFGSSFVDFHVEGPHAYLDTIELSGDAISLVGAGEVDFDTNLHLVFRSIMGDSEQQLPVLKRVLGGASGQFMLVHVDGTLAKPEVSTEAFPTLAAALQKLQSTQRHPDGLRNAASRREARRDVPR